VQKFKLSVKLFLFSFLKLCTEAPECNFWL